MYKVIYFYDSINELHYYVQDFYTNLYGSTIKFTSSKEDAMLVFPEAVEKVLKYMPQSYMSVVVDYTLMLPVK